MEYVEAPSQITHDEGTRRIYVGFNVRGRDIESTVEEIEQLVSKKISLPAGYYYTYGGEFQNLRDAANRLSIAIPVALCLILLLLCYCEKHSRNAFCVQCHTACGYRRNLGVVVGMPFSISAGVGFIALFGVAVLNGIVLVGQLNDLRNEGVGNITERIMKGRDLKEGSARC